jgi:predicted short-subunit dehydrogenase-like oxidoreductase (DUF2520 family)
MIRVVLIGAGNVAIHLARAMEQTEKVRLVQHYSRSTKNSAYFSETIPNTQDIRSLAEADIYLIAVKDEAIEEIAVQIRTKRGMLVHTSGSIPMESLESSPRHGVLYPIQTFSKDREMDWSQTHLALEASSIQEMELLKEMASAFSPRFCEIDSKQRKKLHLAAVFANNFSNHMFALSKEVCEENDLDFDLLKPLIEETGKKVLTVSPEEAQTGPARRGDLEVMLDQENELDEKKRTIYSILSKSITERYRKKN